MNRQQCEFDWFGGNMINNLVGMSGGNPGAATVLMQMAQEDSGKGLVAIIHLDEYNIRGPEIWVGYKDICGQDVTKFIDKVCAGDNDMLEYMKREGGLS